MRTGTFFVRVWRIISIVGFLFSLFNSYISYPNDVAVRFNAIGQASQYVNRETLFYFAAFIFILVYTVTNIVVRLFPRIPTRQVLAPNHAVWAEHRDQLDDIYTNWFKALAAAVNTILALSLMVLSFLNRSDQSNVGPTEYSWLLPLSTAILGIVLLSLPARLLMKPRPDHV